MHKSRGLLEKQGWQEGTGLGRNRDGIANPLVLKTKLPTDPFDYNHYAHVFETALAQVGVTGEEEQSKPVNYFGGMFVKAGSGDYVKKREAVTDESKLLELCEGRTARRSVKVLKLSQEDLDRGVDVAPEQSKQELVAIDEDKKKKKKKKKDKKKEKKKEKKQKTG